LNTLFSFQYNIEKAISNTSVSAKENLAPEEGGDPPQVGRLFRADTEEFEIKKGKLGSKKKADQT